MQVLVDEYVSHGIEIPVNVSFTVSKWKLTFMEIIKELHCHIKSFIKRIFLILSTQRLHLLQDSYHFML